MGALHLAGGLRSVTSISEGEWPGGRTGVLSDIPRLAPGQTIHMLETAGSIRGPRRNGLISMTGPSTGHELLIEEIAIIAFQRWTRAGRPPGRLRVYWRTVEKQFQVPIKQKKPRVNS